MNFINDHEEDWKSGTDGDGSTTMDTTKFDFEPHERVTVKLRGLPFKVRYDDIKDFFREYKTKENSV